MSKTNIAFMLRWLADLRILPVAILTVTLPGCGTVLQRDAPSIAHVHIGHAITGWPLAPKKQGLLVVAEISSIEAAANSSLMLDAARDGNLDRTQRYLRETVLKVDPTLLDPGDEAAYGLRRAAAEAITHLQLASEVEDASSNVQRTVALTNIKARDILDRVDELIAFLDAGMQSENAEELEIIAEEIHRTLMAIAGGPERESGYGLFDFREDIESMVARENPPYKTVDNWFLFNLVKLPNGDWGFSSRQSRGAAGLGY